MSSRTLVGIVCFSLSLLGYKAYAEPPPISIPEHPYPPGSETAFVTYTCMDGGRSVSMQKGQNVKPRIASLVRNDMVSPPWVIERVNGIISRLDAVRAIHPRCHKEADVLIVEGLKNKEKQQLFISWRPDEVQPKP